MYKMAVLSKVKPYSDAVEYLNELPFYNKPNLDQTKNINRLVELLFYEQLSVIKTEKIQLYN